MQKVKVRIPATLTSVGPGIHAVGLALSMHTHVALQVRSDTHLSVTVTGDAADKIPDTIDNLALRAAIRVFQKTEDAPVGLHVEIHNSTPYGIGLGEQTAMVVGGLVAAHNLIDSALNRDDLIRIALSFNLPYEGIVAAMLGSISLCSLTPEEPFTFAYTSLDVPPTRAIVIVPTLPDFNANAVRFPQALLLTDAVRATRQTLMFTEAIRRADYDLLKHTLAYQPHQAEYAKHIPHLAEVQKAALAAGGAGVMVSGNGQMLLGFAQDEPHAVAEAMIAVFEANHVQAQHWVLPFDRQGVVISEIEELNP